MTYLLLCWVAVILTGCGLPDRGNPADPGSQRVGDPEPLQLRAILPDIPDNGEAGPGRLMHVLNYEIRAEDLVEPITGTMNLIGAQARAQVFGVPDGSARIISVDARDVNNIRTYAGVDTVDIGSGRPRILLVDLQRLRGDLELTADLPPEIFRMEVSIFADGDSLMHIFQDFHGRFSERIAGVPTGTGVGVLLCALDNQSQLRLENRLTISVREELVAHLNVPLVTGVLMVEARFPEYVPTVAVDRFSDAAAAFYRRSADSRLPGPDDPIDFDREMFLQRAYGPDGEIVEFYNFDRQNPTPSPVFVLVDRHHDLIAGQLPIFSFLPGEQGHSDLCRIFEVVVPQLEYLVNSHTSRSEINAAGYEVLPTEEVINAVIVPAESQATRRFDATAPVGLHNGWYGSKVVKYLLFEHTGNVATVDFSGDRVDTPLMYAFLQNNNDLAAGFATDPSTGWTHNVFSRLPGLDGYSPLWTLQLFKISAFDRIDNAVSAVAEANSEENLIVLPSVFINAPIVTVE